MDHLFLNVLNVVLPVLICAGIGYCLAVFHAPFDNKVIGGIVSKVGYPTLIISHLPTTKLAVGTFLDMMTAAALAVAAFGVLGFLALRGLRLPVRAFLTPLMHGNVGNIGLPITLLALGDAGMAYTMAFVVVVLVSIFTVGMWIPAGEFSPKKLATSPIIYAVIVSLILMATGQSLPQPISRSFDIMGGLSIPLMLLTLGHTLATLRINSLGRAVLLTALHLVMAVAIASALIWLFGFTGTERGALILCCLMPSSVATYLFIDQHVPEYGPDVAGFILVSTLTTIVVLPVALAYWI
ncbi:AEC family transporter [Rhodobacteraceae bacterium B1Z28]|uniref:AEC family transporter n=1 Tax=Ruegeria haliotis TaxID=2747601 RepID=A0ABX2PTN2_9RHOB|nr:AEC family transporter [Ruegeria haliotis]NVO57540.1 AEC family transporter [Ruegeria haliotis]